MAVIERGQHGVTAAALNDFRAIGGESGPDLCKAVSFDQQVGTGYAIGQNGVFQ